MMPAPQAVGQVLDQLAPEQPVVLAALERLGRPPQLGHHLAHFTL